MIRQTLGNLAIRARRRMGIEGTPCFDERVYDLFFSAPWDVLPEFEGPPGYKWKNARGKDHPRYGRFVYAFAKHYRPEWVIEVGTDTGGTAVGWARALGENKKGTLICVDSDAYSQSTYPQAVKKNIGKIGTPPRVELRSGDSKDLIPKIAQELPGKVDLYLVDGDHTFEGALKDLENGLPMMKKGGFILVHDIDRGRPMNESTPEHPHPVYEAFRQVADRNGFQWCVLPFIRKHLGVMRISG